MRNNTAGMPSSFCRRRPKWCSQMKTPSKPNNHNPPRSPAEPRPGNRPYYISSPQQQSACNLQETRWCLKVTHFLIWKSGCRYKFVTWKSNRPVWISGVASLRLLDVILRNYWTIWSGITGRFQRNTHISVVPAGRHVWRVGQGRPVTKGNSEETTANCTQGQGEALIGFDRIREAALRVIYPR